MNELRTGIGAHLPAVIVDGERAARRLRPDMVAQPQQAAARGHEVARVLEQVESNHVGCQHTAQKLGAVRNDAPHLWGVGSSAERKRMCDARQGEVCWAYLWRRAGRVQEERDDHVRRRVSRPKRGWHKHQRVSVDPDQIPGAGETERGLCKSLVGLDVRRVQGRHVDAVAALASAVPVGDLIVQDGQQNGRAVPVAVFIVQVLRQKDGRAVVLGQQSRHLLLRLLRHALPEAAHEDNLHVQRSHEMASALCRCNQQVPLVPRSTPRAIGRALHVERQVLLHHEQPARRAARRAGAGRTRTGPGSTGAAIGACGAMCAGVGGRVDAGRGTRHAAVAVRGHLRHHLHLRPAKLELPVVRERLPPHGARRLVHHNKLVFDDPVLAQQKWLASPDRIGRFACRHAHAVLRLPAAQLRGIADDGDRLAPLSLHTNLEAHAHKKRRSGEELVHQGHAQMSAERSHRPHRRDQPSRAERQRAPGRPARRYIIIY
eukprot:scaffold18873_cov112-Isochrysis_galbana.AAC.9